MESKPKIVLFCGGPFAYRSLSALAFGKFLAGVVIGTKNYQISAQLKLECDKSAIPFLDVESKEDSEKINFWLKSIMPDAVFSICFPFLVDSTTLAIKPIKFINFHLGPLPGYRGPMPIFEVLRNKERETAISVHQMSAIYDQGALIYMEPIKISTEDNYLTLTQKLAERCGIAVMNMAEMLEFGTVIHMQEQDQTTAKFFPFPRTEELIIDWEKMEIEEIVSLIKACNGWNNGAITFLNNEEIHLLDAYAQAENSIHNQLPGTLLKLNQDGSGEIACRGNKTIYIKQFGNENGIYSADFLCQLKIKAGVKFESKLVTC